MKKIVDLNKRRDKEKAEKLLLQIGLDLEIVKEYDPKALKDISHEFIISFFKEREEVNEKFTSLLRQHFASEKDNIIFWSVMCEHFQNLLEPDMEEINALFLNEKTQENYERGLAKFEKWLAVSEKLESFHLSSMKTYLVESCKDK